jgi:hypothetical protein
VNGTVPADMRVCAQPLCNTVMWLNIFELKVMDKQDTIEVCHICAGNPMQIKHVKRQVVKVFNCTSTEEIQEMLQQVQR